MSRKLLVILTGLTLCLSFTLGFSAAQVTLSVDSMPKEDQAVALSNFNADVKTMMTKYNIVIKGDQYQYAVDSFFPKAAAGTEQDLYQTWYTEPNKLIDNGYMADISAEVKAAGWDKDINPQILSIISRNGKIYALPQAGYYQGLLCNVDLFKKAGLVDANGVPKAPKTYDELLADAKIIKAKTGAAGFIMETANNCGGWHFMNIAWSFGTVFETKGADGKWTATFNSPAGVAALDYVKSLAKAGVLPAQTLLDWSSGQQTFATGQGAMMFFNGSFHTGFQFMIDTYKISKDSISAFSMPAGPKGRFAQLGGTIYAFSPKVTPDQINAGMKWIDLESYSPVYSAESLANEEQQFKNDAAANYVIGSYGLPVYVNKERMTALTTLMKKYSNVNPAMFADYNNISQVTLKAEEPVDCQDLYKELDKVIQAVVTDPNKANSKSLLDAAAADFQKTVLDPYNASLKK